MKEKQGGAYSWSEKQIVKILREQGVDIAHVIRCSDNCSFEFKSLVNLAEMMESTDYTRSYFYKTSSHGKSNIDGLHGHVRRFVTEFRIKNEVYCVKK